VAARRPPAVARVLERVTKTVREHEMFEPADLALVSVSGGPDSVCLLYSLWHLRRLFKIRLAIFHFDHRLRADSSKDAAYVRRLADRLHLPFHLRAASGEPLKGESVEAWAREVRGLAANQVIQDIEAQRLAKGHTLDDQAETVLMGAIRGGGLPALVGIHPKWRDGYEVNPLLDVSREDVETFCRASGLRPRRDPMNEDRRHLRVALRLEGIPALERATGREVKRPLARTASLLRPLWEAIDEPISSSGQSLGRRTDPGFEFDASTLSSLSAATGPDAVRRVLYDLGIAVTQAHIDAVLDLASGRPGRRRDLADGVTARRTRTHVVIER
jgi:tRNA(Ile)-lysidine synthase